MPKLKPITVHAMDKSLERPHVSLTCDMFLTFDGKFQVEVPDYLRDHVMQAAKKTSLPRNKAQKYVLETPTLSEAADLIGVAWRAYHNPDEKVETVILYIIDHTVDAWQLSDGTIIPNGSHAPKVMQPGHNYQSPDGYWLPNPRSGNMDSKPGYAVQIGAHIMEKVTITLNENSRVVYRRPSDSRKLGPQGQTLCEWAKIWLVGVRGAEEMPYTEEAAAFFNSCLFSMANMAVRLLELRKPETLQLAISQGVALLPAPKEQ